MNPTAVRNVCTAVAVMAVSATMTSGCASNKEEARDAAIEDMRAQLAEITESATELIKTKSPQDVRERIDYLYGPSIYKHSASSTEASWQIVLTTDASYSEFIGEHQAIISGCIEMVAKKSDGVDTMTVDCPKSLWKRDMVDNYDEEVDILSN